jgi:glycogen synthase
MRDFNWSAIAEQTIGVYDRVWNEFLSSYWVQGTVWPVSPGAAERAEELRLREKAVTGVPLELPRPRLTMDVHPPTEPLVDEDEWLDSPIV